MKEKILEQIYEVTNSFNEKMMIESLHKQLRSSIFEELINNQKESIIITFKIEVETGDER